MDGLPVRVCVQCSIDLNFCHHLAQKCSQTDAALRCLLDTDAATSIGEVGFILVSVWINFAKLIYGLRRLQLLGQ
jgi:hypothetical protein